MNSALRSTVYTSQPVIQYTNFDVKKCSIVIELDIYNNAPIDFIKEQMCYKFCKDISSYIELDIDENTQKERDILLEQFES